MTKTRSGGFGTTLILALLLVIAGAASGAGLVYLIRNPTEPQEPSVVQGIHRLNDLATVKYTTQVLVTEEENPEVYPARSAWSSRVRF